VRAHAFANRRQHYRRPGFPEAAYGDDVELRANVEALLKAHKESGEFLEQPRL
jgi:hypothetical protein